MKAIISAIGAALRAVVTFIGAALALPARLLGGALGGGVDVPPAGDSPLVERLREEYETKHAELRENGRKMAAIVASWCAESMIAGHPLPAPTLPRVSRAVANWLPGLTREECAELVCAGNEGISEHISGSCAVQGVRAVQPLQALMSWSPASFYVEPTPGFAAIAYAEGGLSSTG